MNIIPFIVNILLIMAPPPANEKDVVAVSLFPHLGGTTATFSVPTAIIADYVSPLLNLSYINYDLPDEDIDINDFSLSISFGHDRFEFTGSVTFLRQGDFDGLPPPGGVNGTPVDEKLRTDSAYFPFQNRFIENSPYAAYLATKYVLIRDRLSKYDHENSNIDTSNEKIFPVLLAVALQLEIPLDNGTPNSGTGTLSVKPSLIATWKATTADLLSAQLGFRVSGAPDGVEGWGTGAELGIAWRREILRHTAWSIAEYLHGYRFGLDVVDQNARSTILLGAQFRAAEYSQFGGLISVGFTGSLSSGIDNPVGAFISFSLASSPIEVPVRWRK